jgi:hypothetical protein
LMGNQPRGIPLVFQSGSSHSSANRRCRMSVCHALQRSPDQTRPGVLCESLRVVGGGHHLQARGWLFVPQSRSVGEDRARLSQRDDAASCSTTPDLPKGGTKLWHRLGYHRFIRMQRRTAASTLTMFPWRCSPPRRLRLLCTAAEWTRSAKTFSASHPAESVIRAHGNRG